MYSKPISISHAVVGEGGCLLMSEMPLYMAFGHAVVNLRFRVTKRLHEEGRAGL